MREWCRAFTACVCAVAVAVVECVSRAPPPPHAHAHNASTSSRHDQQKNSSLVHELRRQLMEDNYDYMPSETEEPLGRQPLFNQKDIDIIRDKQDESTATTAASTVGRAYTHVDKTHLEFDLEYNNPYKENDNLNVHNNLNTTYNRFDNQLDGHRKEYTNLDKDYKDLQQKPNKIGQEFDKKEFDSQLNDDNNILKKEHDILNAKFEKDPTNREYDTPGVYKDFDKSNQILDDSDFMYEKRKNKYGKSHKDRLNKNMEDKLKKHHHEGYNDVNRLEYNKHGDRKKGIKNLETGYHLRAHDDSDEQDETSSGTSKKHGVHKNDLLYYMNDERLKQAEENYLDLSNANEYGTSDSTGSSDSGSDYDHDTTTVKYNVFTVKSERDSGRRAGSARAVGARAFVREQRPGEVVVVRLDDAPFPQFRLPAARRQYMHGEN